MLLLLAEDMIAGPPFRVDRVLALDLLDRSEVLLDGVLHRVRPFRIAGADDFQELPDRRLHGLKGKARDPARAPKKTGHLMEGGMR